MRIEAGQVAVITGGASGIGYGLAETLGRRGVNVVVADIREEGLAEAAAALRHEGVETVTAVTDVSDRASVAELAALTLDRFGRVDLVCNNAGVVSPAAPMWDQTPQTWDRMIGIKFLGVVHGVAAFAPTMLRQGYGHFLNTASSGGLAPLPDRTPYSGTMHAVVGLTETLDLELKRESPALGATVLCPGLVDTPLGANSATLGAIELPRGVESSMRSIAAAAGGILTPNEVAEHALAAVEAGRIHSAPGAGVPDRARARIDVVASNLDTGA
jgi:NAD(P)-dependent dehydrogenase (short-subunit alcohol dehydrogenase family)